MTHVSEAGMENGAVQMVVREHSGVRINVTHNADHHHLHFQKESNTNQTLAILSD